MASEKPAQTYAPIRLRLADALLLAIIAGAGCRSLDAERALTHPPGQLIAKSQPSPRPIIAGVGAMCGEIRLAKDEEPPVADSVPAPVPPSAPECRIELDRAVAIAAANNPTIAQAAEHIRAALARQLQARALILPDLDAGLDYDLHAGNLLSARGIVRDEFRQSLYLGAGAAAFGSGTVTIPGVNLSVPVADAIFEPRIARQDVTGRRLDAVGVRNNILLAVILRYFDLASAEARLEATRRSLAETGEIVRLTTNFARTGQGREGDAERARSEAHLLMVQLRQIEEEVEVASAELARLLNLDPAVRLRAVGGPIPEFQLVDASSGLEELVQMAVANRPEVAARAADIAQRDTRLRQERIRPLAPIVSLGFSAGAFGGGGDQAGALFSPLGGRTDVDFLAVWRLDNLGAGNRAVRRRVRAERDETAAEYQRVVDQVRREVADAYALLADRRREIESARQQVQTAERAYQLDLERARNLVGKAQPIEVLNSADLLNNARQNLIRATVGYGQARFQLLVAIGNPPLAKSGPY